MTTGEPLRRGVGSTQQTVRRQNLALVLREIAEGEPVSRAGVAQRTGLTRGTVSSLVEELIAGELVTELAAARGTTGRPASPLQLNRAGPAGLGIEIGVDEVAACVVDLAGTVRARRSTPSDHRTREPTAGLDRAADLAADVVAEAGLPVEGAGVALPGVVGRDGVLQRAPNLPRWVDVAVDAELAARLGLPVDVGNEADLAAAAELWFGDAPTDFVHVSGGIGVGGGIVLGGELFRGPGGRAGELGHLVVDPDGPVCSCGGRGCLEQLAGQPALLAAAGVADVGDLLRSPGPAVAVAGRALGVALAGVVNLVDVPTVVLGGLYARLGAPLAVAVTAELRERVPSRTDLRVRLSAPDTGGALRAAAGLVVRRRLRQP
ncbi:ROK family transcriptional regulator [Pseudonocardia lacus]|uniref:ROK family transcriptional regulator n=1 Tax=Pseudonocardia lacus TaxID=2835865 RepID=UPI0027E303E2|nr:ROK family transcriptional regulator [Pseudonocardia lacus]